MSDSTNFASSDAKPCGGYKQTSFDRGDACCGPAAGKVHLSSPAEVAAYMRNHTCTPRDGILKPAPMGRDAK